MATTVCRYDSRPFLQSGIIQGFCSARVSPTLDFSLHPAPHAALFPEVPQPPPPPTTGREKSRPMTIVEDTPARGRKRERWLLVTDVVQRLPGFAKEISVKRLTEKLKEVHGADAVYAHDANAWASTIGRVACETNAVLLKDFHMESFDRKRENFLRIRKMGRTYERVVYCAQEYDAGRLLSTMAEENESVTTNDSGANADNESSSRMISAPEAGDVVAERESSLDAEAISPYKLEIDKEAYGKSAEAISPYKLEIDKDAYGKSVVAVKLGKRHRRQENSRLNTKRRKPMLPACKPYEDNLSFAFRVLNHLASMKEITNDQRKICRQLLAEEIRAGLLAALVAYPIDGDITPVKDVLEQVAPQPPRLLDHVFKTIKDEARKLTVKKLTALTLKGITYGAAFVGVRDVVVDQLPRLREWVSPTSPDL